MSEQRPYALSIAGFDPSGGAGVLADIKTFESNGVYGFGVVSALTWQNDVEFDRIEWVNLDKIKEQISVLLRRFEIRYVKIGLIESVDVLNQLVDFLHERMKEPLIVFDPVLKASAGFVFHKSEDTNLQKAMKGIYCITPNVPEAEQLFGADDLQTKLEDASETINIYLKGGHNEEQVCTDLLFLQDHTYAFSNDRLEKGEKHGSGCVLSSALTARLALGEDLPTAAENANTYTYNFLASNDTKLGYHKPLIHETVHK